MSKSIALNNTPTLSIRKFLTAGLLTGITSSTSP